MWGEARRDREPAPRGSVPPLRDDRHAAGRAARRSRDALADAVDPAFRGARQPAVSSAEDRRFLSPLYWAGSGRDWRDRGRARRRLYHHRLPRSCSRACSRHERERLYGGALWKRNWLLPRLGWLDAFF